MRRSFCLLMMLMACAACFAGYTFDDVKIEYWAGQGANQSLVVFDFNADNSFAFGYRWDNQKSSFDALLAIDQASEDFSMTYSWVDSLGGYFIDNFSYLETSRRGSSWSFYTAADGENWSESWIGASDRVLTNGSWDGWACGNFVWVGPGDWDFVFTGSVATPVPEPATAVLLVLGLLAFRRK